MFHAGASCVLKKRFVFMVTCNEFKLFFPPIDIQQALVQHTQYPCRFVILATKALQSQASRQTSIFYIANATRYQIHSETGDNGNAMFQSYLSQLFKKKKRLKIRSCRRYGEHGEKMLVFLGLFVHAAVRGGTCAFWLKIVSTPIKNSTRDERPSIST